jgi:hypothetical protein
MENELFTSISNGDIKNSILITTKIIFLHNSFELLENAYIDVCAYIGSFVSLYDISKLIDIYANTKIIIEAEKIIIKDIYVLITKMCILCDIYNKHPTAKCGSMSLKTLKEKISPIFNNEDMKLSANGLMKFDGILPPQDNENYAVALRIIALIIKTVKSTDNISVDNGNTLTHTAYTLRYALDYILRTKYKFETKFYATDNDNTWFIWGVFSILYKDTCFNDAFWLYNHEFKKKYKPKRIGILWSLGIICIYIHKKDISRGWTEKEASVIKKIDEIAIKLYNEIRHKLIDEYPDAQRAQHAQHANTHKSSENKNDGLDFILNYVPILHPQELAQASRARIVENHNKQEIKDIRSISF